MVSELADREVRTGVGGVANAKADVALGFVIGILAGSNLVQGSWTSVAPWLDATSISLALILPIAFLQHMRFGMRVKGLGAFFVLAGALALGYVPSALDPAAESKRLQIVVGVLFVFVAGYLVSATRGRVTGLCASLVLQAHVALAALLINPDPAALEATGRLTPIGLNAIGVGRIMAGGVLVLSCLAVRQATARPARACLAGALALPLIWGIYETGSRGPVIAAALALALAVLRGPVPRTLKTGVSIAGAATMLLSFEYLAEAGSRLVGMDGSGRQDLVAQTMRVAFENPFGIGWGNLYAYLPTWAVSQEQGWNQYAHNVILEFAVEAGIVSAVLIAALLSGVLRLSWRLIGSGRLSGSLVGALAVFSVVGAMFSSDVIGNRMMWVLCGAVLAEGRRRAGGCSSFDLSGQSAADGSRPNRRVMA